MTKLRPDTLTGVSETLLIPLHYRVEESRRPDGAFHDALADAFVDAIEYDWARFQRGGVLRPTVIARTLILDRAAREFMAASPGGLVVCLGAGLDTRFARVDDGRVRWLDVDLPDVIAFRRRLPEPSSERHALFAGSVLDRAWIDEARARRQGGPVLLLAEGLLPYFSEAEHRAIFASLASGFQGSELYFQTSAPSLVARFANSSELPSLRTGDRVSLRWGLEEGRDVEALCPGVRYLGEVSLVEACRDQLPAALLTALGAEDLRRLAKIVHVRFA